MHFDSLLVDMYVQTFHHRHRRDGILAGILQVKPAEPLSPFSMHLESSHIMSSHALSHLYRQLFVERPALDLIMTALGYSNVSPMDRCMAMLVADGSCTTGIKATKDPELASALCRSWAIQNNVSFSAAPCSASNSSVAHSGLCPHVKVQDGHFNRIQLAVGVMLREVGIEMRDWTPAFRTPYWDHRHLVDWSGASHGFTVPVERVLFAPVQWPFLDSVKTCCSPYECIYTRMAGTKQPPPHCQTSKADADSCCKDHPVSPLLLEIRTNLSVGRSGWRYESQAASFAENKACLLDKRMRINGRTGLSLDPGRGGS